MKLIQIPLMVFPDGTSAALLERNGGFDLDELYEKHSDYADADGAQFYKVEVYVQEPVKIKVLQSSAKPVEKGDE